MPEASQGTTEVPVTRKRKCPPSRRVTADLVADRDLAEEGEVGIAVAGIDRGAGLARGRRALHMPGPKASACPLAPASTMALRPQARDRDVRHRPGVGPGPRLDVMAGRQGRGECAFEQNLRDHALDVYPDRLPDERSATDHQRAARGERDADPPQRTCADARMSVRTRTCGSPG